MKNKILISFITALLALSSFLMGKLGVTPIHPLGSVSVGNEYYATTTNTQALWNNYTVLRSPSGSNNNGNPTILGTINITTTGTSPMCFYDGTSTVTNGEWATTTIACFAASPTVGSYTFDAQYKKGILLEFTGSPSATGRASTTITYR